MPMFLDHHMVVPTEEMKEAARQAIKSGEKSPLGTQALNGFIANDQSWCLNNAPNAQAVHDLHEQLGLHLGPGDVVEVQALG